MPKKRILRLNLKRKYWEEIRDGKKLFEYRLATPFWCRRLEGIRYDEIHLCLGYPATGDMSRTLIRKWVAYPQGKQITHEHFGKNEVTVYAIDVSHKV